jgi:membrane fusion protein, multidrug efflux system
MRSKPTFVKFLVVFGIVILVAAALWFFRDALFGEPEPAGEERAPTPVTTVTAATGTVRRTAEAVGTTQAREQVSLTAEVTARIEAIEFEEGSLVEEGDLLVQLDASQARAAVDAAIAVRDEAREALRRAEELDTGRIIAEAEVDERRRRFETAEAEVEQAEAQLDEYAIVAPFSGRIGIRQVSPGFLVTPETVIATLSTIDPIELQFDLPETLLPDLAAGMEVIARPRDDGDRQFEGIVTIVDATVNAGTRTVTLKAELPNADGALLPGMFMMVNAVLEVVPDAVLVPEEAILLRGEESFVFIVRDGIAQRVTVETGERRAGVVEIRAGLEPGASVVIAGLQQISDGQRVSATPSEGGGERHDEPRATGRAG